MLGAHKALDADRWPAPWSSFWGDSEVFTVIKARSRPPAGQRKRSAKKMKIVTVFVSIVFVVASAWAVPFPPSEPVNLSGTIDSFVWVDKAYFEYVGDDILLSSAQAPAHYLVIVKTTSVDKKTRELLTFETKVAGFMGLSHAISSVELEEDEMIILITSSKIKSMKKGAKIEITGYSLSGDERGRGEVFKSLKIDGVTVQRPQAEQGGARQPTTAPDSKSEGSEKPKPESEGRSQ